MTIYESGREALYFDNILKGKRSIEGRLNRGKFAGYNVGDQIWLRKDYRDEYGILHDGEPRQALVEITGVRQYSSFSELLEAEGFRNVVPYAQNSEEALAEFNYYYSTDEQMENGVLAIEVELVSQYTEI